MQATMRPAVDRRQIDLPLLLGRGVLDIEPGAVAQLHRLHGQREGAGDDRLGSDHRGGGGEDHQRAAGPSSAPNGRRGWPQPPGCSSEQRALAEVVEQQRRQHDREPGDPDRAGAEVSHVGIERLAAGHHQEHRPENQNAAPAVAQEIADGIEGIGRGENRRMEDDLVQAEQGQNQEPHQRHRSEKGPDAGGPPALQNEESDNDDDGKRNHVRIEQGSHDPQTLDGAQNRDGRGDHAVAVQQGGAEQAEDDEQPAPPFGGGPHRGHKRRQGEDASFSLVVRHQNENQVFNWK